MSEYTRGQLVDAAEKHYTFKPITVLVKCTDKNIYGVIAEQHPQINVDLMQVRYITLVKLSVGVNSYLEVQQEAEHTNSTKMLINKTVTRYFHGGETEERMLVAKVDTDTGEFEMAVPNDFVLEVKLVTR